MQASEFINKVKEQLGTGDDQQARMWIRAVFGALRDRISPGGADNLASQLPRELRELWDAGFAHEAVHAIAGVEHLTRSEFLSRVRKAAQLENTSQTERVVMAVFAALKEQLSDGEIMAVEKQLPEDLAILWSESGFVTGPYDSEEIGPAAAEVFRHDDQLKREIEELLEVNDEVDESSIDVEVHQGRVELTGTVKSEEEREAAARAVRLAWGVAEVKNELRVEG